jgi:hypothetical protein
MIEGVFDWVMTGRHHDDGGNARLRDQRSDSQRQRREAEAADDRDLLVDDEFLREAARLVSDARVVAHHEFDLLARDGIAVMRHKQPRASEHLPAGCGLRAGERKDEADLYRLLREHGWRWPERAGESAGRKDVSAIEHMNSPLLQNFCAGAATCGGGALDYRVLMRRRQSARLSFPHSPSAAVSGASADRDGRCGN